MDNTIKNILVIFLLVLIFYLLSVLSSLLIPLVLALLFAAIFQPIIKRLTKMKAPNWLIIPLIIIITLGIFYGLFNIIVSAVTQITEQKEFLMSRLNSRANTLVVWVNSSEGLKLIYEKIAGSLVEMVNKDFISNAAGGIASWLGSFTSSFMMFALYYIILLSGMSNIDNFINYIDIKKQGNIKDYYDKIQSSIINYIVIKGIISVSNATMVGLICLAFGVKFPILWAFLVLILNFIPSIGSVSRNPSPFIMSVIQFDSFEKSLLFLLCIVAAQFSIGNFIEPKIMGNKLKLNTVTVIFGLVFWGYIWGIPGMLLSVPLMVSIKLIFEHSQSLGVVARIMGSPEKIKTGN